MIATDSTRIKCTEQGILDKGVCPLFPAYLQITGIVACPIEDASPFKPRYNLTVERYPYSQDPILVPVSDIDIYLLCISDGRYNLTDCQERISREVTPVSHEDMQIIVGHLFAFGVLIDARTQPYARPAQGDRYARHKLFYGSLGYDGALAQERLGQAHVTIVGVGGIGCWVSYLLVAAGVRRITLIDGDRIEESNLTRQVLFTHADVGQYKAETALIRLKALDPTLEGMYLNHYLEDAAMLKEMCPHSDLIIVSGDKPSNLYEMVNNFCIQHKIPWIAAGYHHHVAVVGPFHSVKDAGFYRQNFSALSDSLSLPFIAEINSRYQVPSFSPINGMAACMAAKEAIAYLSGVHSLMIPDGSAFIFDALDNCGGAVPMPHDEPLQKAICDVAPSVPGEPHAQ